MENKGLISIIVPVYNAENFLKECIDSILKQTYQKYELILVDDGSTDKSWEIVNEYMGIYEKIRGFRKSNGGPNSARKKGMEMANGEFVMFVDADDYIDKTICSKLINNIISNKVDIVLSKIMKIVNNVETDIVGNWGSGKYKGKYIAENIIDQDIFYINYIPMGLYANLYKRDIVQGIFRDIDLKIDFSEDYVCLLLALLDSEYVYFLDEALYYYRQNSSSLTHKHSKSNFESQKYMYRFLIKQLKRRNASSIIYKQLEWIIIRDILLGGYEAFKDKEYLYPFRNVQKGSDVVIYGAGVLGGEILAFVNQYHICNVVLWVDQNWREYQESGTSVSSIEKINNVDYDYIIIAVLKINIATNIKQTLKERGIKESKIKVIDQNLISYSELPKEFWD